MFVNAQMYIENAGRIVEVGQKIVIFPDYRLSRLNLSL